MFWAGHYGPHGELKTYRANYDHAKKEHRCTAQNGNGVTSRSDWTVAGRTARTDFISQTLANNRAMQVLNKKVRF